MYMKAEKLYAPVHKTQHHAGAIISHAVLKNNGQRSCRHYQTILAFCPTQKIFGSDVCLSTICFVQDPPVVTSNQEFYTAELTSFRF